MNYRKLSSCEAGVSELCFGTMRYADKNGPENEKSAAGRSALEEAIERGVNFIHSSYEYQTRWLTGSVLKQHPRRSELHHIIKVNVPDWEEPRFSADSFRRQVEDALTELSTDRIAVVQHLQRGVPRKEITSDSGTNHRLAQFDEVTSELGEIADRLREEGKIGSVMSFPYTVEYAARAVESDVYAGLVAYFNPLETEMSPYFARLAELGKDFISIRPLAGGILTDRRVNRSTLPAHDRMQDSRWDTFYRQLEALKPVIGELSMSWEQYAYRFSLADPVIKSSVLGINTIDHLATAADVPPVPADAVKRVHQVNVKELQQ